MQSVGVLLLTVAAYLIYCGVTGIPPWATAMELVTRPGDAAAILADAREESAEFVKSQGPGEVEGDATKNFGGKNYNPFTALNITGTWDTHIEDGSQGGIDYGAKVGTPLPAPFSGTVDYQAGEGSGGNIVTVTSGTGYKSQYLHCSASKVPNGTIVSTGTIIALSGGEPGAPGAGSSTGPHVHWHMIAPSGKRVNPLLNFMKG